jgi:hypothetical protein
MSACLLTSEDHRAFLDGSGPHGAGEIRLVIFGFTRGVDETQVRTLLAACGTPMRRAGDQVRLEIHDLPGDNDAVMVIVHLLPDWRLADQLARQVNQRRYHGRHLQSWVPVMAWQ